jgi:hypothetical protein
MMHYTTAQALGQARLADLHGQAQREALARAARHARRSHSAYRLPGLLAALTPRARRPRPLPESLRPGPCSTVTLGEGPAAMP